jgi:hypothetical protein
MNRKLLLMTSLVGLPLLSFAQTTPNSARFYVGVGANLLTDVPFNSTGAPKLVGPSLTAGIQLTPQLALQVSPAYQGETDSYTSPAYDYRTGMLVGTTTTTVRSKYLTVPLLLRYTFTEAATPFQFDGLAGITVLHGSYHYTTSDPNTSGYYTNDFSSSSTKACFTLGPAVRYTLSPQVELTANALVSAVLGDRYNSFSDRLFLNALVGVHYKFGQL